jgi:phosphoribosylformimino-5-aminoimidazole carboxamide ribonucleotide (ProFAR) isomerase
VELLEQVLSAGLPVVAAGGISSTADLVALQELGCEAAVTGSALLAGRFTLAEARTALAAAGDRR